jgi:hypothetical protein
MDDTMNAVAFFWFPLSMMALGAWVSLSSKNNLRTNFGRFISVLGFVLVCVSPWTVPTSPSSSIGHLIGFIVGPSSLLLIGIYLLTFSGNVPVGKLPSSDRKLGAFCLILGSLWFSLMQWGEFTPIYEGSEVNRFWLIFFPTFILMICCLSSVLSISMLIIGEERQKESKVMTSISLISMVLIVCGLTIHGENISSETFANYFWLSVSDLFGILVGTSLSIFIFGFVIYVYERSIGEPDSVPPPTSEELSQASEKIALNIGGFESE